MIYLGIDWAEAHHDACVMDEAGGVLAKGRVPEGVEGVAKLHEMVASFAEEPSEVIVGIETDRGLLVEALITTGYRVYAINPMAASRYRDRHGVAGAKSDPGDAKVLADLVRTDRHNHREVAGDCRRTRCAHCSPAPDVNATSSRVPPRSSKGCGLRSCRRNGSWRRPSGPPWSRPWAIVRTLDTRRVVLARVARNKRLADAMYLWAFSSLQASPGARACYDRQRTAGKTHHQALRTLANRWVGILHGCLAHRSIHDEYVAWTSRREVAA